MFYFLYLLFLQYRPNFIENMLYSAAFDSLNALHYNIQQRKRFVAGADSVVEYVTMGQIESAIEEYYQAHGTIISFYAALIYLRQQGKTFTQQPIAPDFTKWNLKIQELLEYQDGFNNKHKRVYFSFVF